jgi:hypothetical protein
VADTIPTLPAGITAEASLISIEASGPVGLGPDSMHASCPFWAHACFAAASPFAASSSDVR